MTGTGVEIKQTGYLFFYVYCSVESTRTHVYLKDCVTFSAEIFCCSRLLQMSIPKYRIRTAYTIFRLNLCVWFTASTAVLNCNTWLYIISYLIHVRGVITEHISLFMQWMLLGVCDVCTRRHIIHSQRQSDLSNFPFTASPLYFSFGSIYNVLSIEQQFRCIGTYNCCPFELFWWHNYVYAL